MVEGLTELEERLTVSKAEEQSKEAYLGEAGVGRIIGVEPNPDDGFAVFKVSLPDYTVGKIGFSELEYENGDFDLFIDNLHSTVSDMTDVAYHSVPVTYTENRGWVLLFGENSGQLESTYSCAGSKWYNIDERDGRLFMSPLQQFMLSVPMLLSVVGYFAVGLNGIATVFGFLISLIAWHVAYMVAGMSDPKQKQVNVVSE